MERDTGIEPEIFINDSECLATIETELTRNSTPLAESSRHSEGPNAEPAEVSDAELQRALVAAVLGGMAAAAATLAATLDERRRGRTLTNVIDLYERRGQ